MILNRFSIRLRIIVLALVPLIALLLLLSERLIIANKQLFLLKNLTVLVNFNTESGLLVEMLQQERDYSFGFTGPNLSIAEGYRKNLDNSRSSADLQVSQFKNYVDEQSKFLNSNPQF